VYGSAHANVSSSDSRSTIRQTHRARANSLRSPTRGCFIPGDGAARRLRPGGGSRLIAQRDRLRRRPPRAPGPRPLSASASKSRHTCHSHQGSGFALHPRIILQ
jgi:hypothetical protein